MEKQYQELSDRIASLTTEVRYLKWIIPAACGFVVLLLGVFWGVERNSIGDRVSAALDRAGLESAMSEIRRARDDALTTVDEIEKARATLPFESIEVLSADHSSGRRGMYFNFDVAELDRRLGFSGWNSRNFTVINTRTGMISAAVLWRTSSGGSKGDGHGRFDPGGEGQWKTGDRALIIHAPDGQ